jgi:anti-sigma-K factor RskA
MPQDLDRPFAPDDRCLAAPRNRAVRYRPSFETDIRKTFERERKRLAALDAALQAAQPAEPAPAAISLCPRPPKAAA